MRDCPRNSEDDLESNVPIYTYQTCSAICRMAQMNNVVFKSFTNVSINVCAILRLKGVNIGDNQVMFQLINVKLYFSNQHRHEIFD